MSETIPMNPLTVAPTGVETSGDQAASTKAAQLADVLATQALYALSCLERTLTFLDTDYVRPSLSAPDLGLVFLRDCLIAHPERVVAVREDAKRFRFEAAQASFDALMKRVEAEIADAENHVALSGLVARLDDLVNEARVHWQSGRRELAINALRHAFRVTERAFQPLVQPKTGQGDPDRAKRDSARRARQLARSVGPKGPSTPTGPQNGKRGR